MTTVIAGAIAIGMALGLLGSGGSILTVPVLVYGLGMPEKSAIASSLAIVGAIALVGALMQVRHGNVVGRCILAFGIPGVAGAATGGLFAAWLPGSVQMLVFAVVVTVAAVQMYRGFGHYDASGTGGSLPAMAGAGAAVGALTAIIGVGGGFLLVPVLMRFGRLPIGKAIGTSLALIAINALSGFSAHLLSPAELALDGRVIGIFIAVGVAGVIAGQHARARLDATRLRHGFATMLLLVGTGVIGHALFA